MLQSIHVIGLLNVNSKLLCKPMENEKYHKNLVGKKINSSLKFNICMFCIELILSQINNQLSNYLTVVTTQ